MKKALTTLLIIISLTSFAQQKRAEYIAPQIKPYVDMYFKDLKRYGIKFEKKDFGVMFSTKLVGTPYSGIAYGMFNDNLVYVAINPYQWLILGETERKYLIYHELSHDLFNLKHNDFSFIMKSKMSPSYEYYFVVDMFVVDTLMNQIKENGKTN